MIVAVLAALAAGLCFAAAGVLQQRVAGTRPEGESLSLELLARLAGQRLWLAGMGLAALAYGFQCLALAFGPLSLIQPLIVTELLFALPLSARLHAMRMNPRGWAGAVAVAAGLAAALGLGAPNGGDPRIGSAEWAYVLLAGTGLVAVSLLLARRVRGTPRASVLALAGGIVLGLQAALIKTGVAHLEHGIGPVLASWQSYVLVLVSIAALLLVQSAYQAGPLAAVMPVIDGTEPVVAVTIGLAVFGESLAGSLWREVVAAVGIVVAVAGIAILDTSPMLRELHVRTRRSAASESDGGQVDLYGASRHHHHGRRCRSSP